MSCVLSAATLDALVASAPPLDGFGPGSERPWLAVALARAARHHGDWLRARPCPVIGIGSGPLAASCDVLIDDAGGLGRLTDTIGATPHAATIFVQHLRASEALPMAAGLIAESFAYGTLQAGPEFRRWLAGGKPAPLPASDERLRVVRAGQTLHLTLAAPARRNAIDVAMRDALIEALGLALADHDIVEVRIDAEGPCFSIGGAVEEFGLAADPATAHHVRSLRLPATRLAALAPRLRVHVRGAAIGAGLEMAAFAGQLTATPDAWFQLPELRYGLIPGAGGTVSVVHRIGRQRAAWLGLSMARLRAPEALAWGLIDAIAE